MNLVFEAYQNIYKQVGEITAQIESREAEIQKISEDGKSRYPERIKNLELALENIDDYLLRVKGFQELAKRCIESTNVSTIEAPAGYRVNLNRLRNWSMMIDPTSSNDPYAQRVYAVAKCDECFLEKKKREFTDKIQELQSDNLSQNNSEIERLQFEIRDLKMALSQLAHSNLVRSFCAQVVDANRFYAVQSQLDTALTESKQGDWISLGTCSLPFAFNQEEDKVYLKNLLGEFYSQEHGRVLLPAEIAAGKEHILTVSCAPTKRKALDAGIQNLIASWLNASPIGMRKIYVLDAFRYSSASIASLRKLEDSFVIDRIPKNPEQLSAKLEQMMSSFIDLEEILEEYDSISEYNQKNTEENQISSSTVILFGWPHSFSQHDQDLIKKMMVNYGRYGISFVLVGYTGDGKEFSAQNMPEYAWNNSIRVLMSENATTLTFPGTASRNFRWYADTFEISDAFLEALQKKSVSRAKKGSEYIKRVDISGVPQYKRGQKSITLPYGVDSKDNVQSISFDNECFATYLMGASGSGKSTLLHVLITGILNQYHPDDVELWLADFKMSEFAQYINPMPPHIKYILLDESRELIFDLIDRLTEKMMERQRFFVKHKEMKKVENIPDNIYMPVLFVILDEFSIMSQAVASSESYQLKLQNLLAKGRALGIKFIFSSQTFTKGVVGLTPTAKEQIQSRIAMKNSYDEINETLELSYSMKTDQIKNWIHALPPYYTLSKYREGDNVKVKRLKTMYFAGAGDEALQPQANLIRSINAAMHPVQDTDYSRLQPDEYLFKDPVVVDGNSFDSFAEKEDLFTQWLRHAENSEDFAGDELFINIGTPRKMVPLRPVELLPESRENAVILSSSEYACTASVLYSALRSFELQSAAVTVFAYERDKIFRKYKSIWQQYPCYTDAKTVAEQMHEIRSKLEAETNEKPQLILILGAERLLSNFEQVDDSLKTSGGISDLSQCAGLTEAAEDEPDLLSFLNAQMGEPAEQPQAPEAPSEKANETETATETLPAQPSLPTTVSLRPKEDFEYLLKVGSRQGCHLFMVFNALTDMKQASVSPDAFRHKLAFRLSKDDSWSFFSDNTAGTLPEHICQYSNGIDSFSLRPYLHKGILWDSWVLDDDGKPSNI